MASTGDGDGYTGPARLALGDASFDVVADLRGRFEPIDGRYRWYGRLARHDGLTAALARGRGTGVLTTPGASASCELSDPDPWQRFRVTGTARPPFPAGEAGAPEVQPGLAAARGALAESSGASAGGPSPERAAITGGGGAWPGHVAVAVVGAGFGGIGVGVALRQAGLTNFVILERAGAIGGTWRDNTYPGCACDVPSHVYSYSFAPNAGWSHSFSRQDEIWRYLEGVTDRYQVCAGTSGSGPRSPRRAGTRPRCAGGCRPPAARSPPT
jgi:hypothetical protein